MSHADTTTNEVSGPVRGNIVQAREVRQVVQVFDAGGEPVVPAQLPPVPGSFTSRQRELDRLRRWHTGDPSIVVLHGVGGVGKTTLALRWLHDVAGDFPDGNLFVDLRAFSAEEPVSPEDALEWFLVALGVRPDRIPSGLAARAGLYRSLVAGRCFAVLIDNAMSAAQVRPLLPGGASVAVVTSRLRLAGLGMDGAQFVEVDPMDLAASVELLAKVVDDDRPTAEPQAVQELARLCGGLPIALSVVGARLSTRPRRPLAREASTLREQRLAALTLEGEPSVQILFDLSYQELPAGAARLYRLCSAHPAGHFDVPAAAACAGLPLGETEELLDILIDANLLREVDDRTFAYHDLLRLHAREQITDAEHDAARRRLVEWYLDVLVSAEKTLHPVRYRVGPRFGVVEPRFATDTEALVWLTGHWGTVQWAVSTAATSGWDDLTWQLAEACWGFSLHSRRYRAAIELFRAGADAARRCRTPVAEARLRSQTGFMYAKLGRYDEAVDQNAEALRLAEATGDERVLATALAQLGRVARGRGDLAAALAYFGRARDIQSALGDRRYAAMHGRRIGQVLADLGRHDEAARELTAAAATMAEIGDRIQHARALMFLGIAHMRSGRPEGAREPLRTALALMRELGSPHYQAEVLTAAGELAARTGDVPAARRAFDEAVQLYDEGEDPRSARVRALMAALPDTSAE